MRYTNTATPVLADGSSRRSCSLADVFAAIRVAGQWFCIRSGSAYTAIADSMIAMRGAVFRRNAGKIGTPTGNIRRALRAV